MLQKMEKACVVKEQMLPFSSLYAFEAFILKAAGK